MLGYVMLEDVYSVVVLMCMYLYYVCRRDLLSASHLVYDWDEEGVRSLIQWVSEPGRSRVFVISSAYPSHKNQNIDDDDEDEDDDEEDDDDEDDEEEEDDDDSNSDDDDDDDEEGVPTIAAAAALAESYTGPAKYRALVDVPALTNAVIEPRFHTTYWVQKLPADLLQSPWATSAAASTTIKSGKGKVDNKHNSPPAAAAVTEQRSAVMRIPDPNPFIPVSFTLEASLASCDTHTPSTPITSTVTTDVNHDTNTASSLSVTAEQAQSPHPTLLVTLPGLRVWHT
jgi:hypothetical protein